MRRRNLMSLLLLVLPLATSAQQGLTLDQYLSQVKTKHRGLSAQSLLEEAALDRREGGDLELVPTFILNSRYLADKSQPNAFSASETQSYLNTASLEKHFSTGTTIGLTGQANEFKNVGLAAGSARGQYSAGAVGITLSQSLWKDFFGESTDLRREREQATYQLETEAAKLEAQGLLLNAENAFWDYLYLSRDLEAQKESLTRAQRIERWVTRRLGDGIGDRADLMNSRALLATRELQLSLTRDNLIAAEQTIRNFLELGPNEPTPPLTADLNKKRPLDIYLQGTGTIVRRDSYLRALEAKVKGVVADEVREGFKPDLVLNGYYNLTSYNPSTGTLSDATKNVSNDFSQSSVGVNFVYLFDTSTKTANVSAAKKEALAAKLNKERALLESASSWTEMVRRYDEFSKRVEIAKNINQFQFERSKAQQDKLTKGRAITSDVITAEQDAANAGLSFLQLSAEQRKMEAQSRMYLKTEDNL